METRNGLNCIPRATFYVPSYKAYEYKGCINGKTDTILLQWPLCSSRQWSVEGFPVILNVQPPYKPPFKGLAPCWTIPTRKESQKPPLGLLGEKLSRVGVGRLRLRRQRSGGGKWAGRARTSPGPPAWRRPRLIGWDVQRKSSKGLGERAGSTHCKCGLSCRWADHGTRNRLR